MVFSVVSCFCAVILPTVDMDSRDALSHQMKIFILLSVSVCKEMVLEGNLVETRNVKLVQIHQLLS